MRSYAKAMKTVRDLHKAKQSALRFNWMNSCRGFMLWNTELQPLLKSLLKSHRKGEWTSACMRAGQESNRFVFHGSLWPAWSGYIHIQKTLRRVSAVAFQ